MDREALVDAVEEQGLLTVFADSALNVHKIEGTDYLDRNDLELIQETVVLLRELWLSFKMRVELGAEFDCE